MKFYKVEVHGFIELLTWEIELCPEKEMIQITRTMRGDNAQTLSIAHTEYIPPLGLNTAYNQLIIERNKRVKIIKELGYLETDTFIYKIYNKYDIGEIV